jgi:hypothetical protein
MWCGVCISGDSLEGLSIYVNPHPQPAAYPPPEAESGAEESPARRKDTARATARASTSQRGLVSVEKQVEMMADMVARFARVATPQDAHYVDATSHPIDFDSSLESLDGDEEQPRRYGWRRGGPRFLVWPIDASLRLKLSKSAVRHVEQAKYDATLEMSVVNLRLEKRQYRHIIRTLDLFNNLQRIAQYAELRPKDPVLSRPRAWWHYAFSCLVWERQLRLGRFDKARLLRTLVHWTEYARLYRTKMLDSTGPSLPHRESLRERIVGLEDKLPLPAISFARQCVWRQLKREARTAGCSETTLAATDAPDKVSASAPSTPARRTGGWFSGWTWSSRSRATEMQTEVAVGEGHVADQRLLHAQLMREMGVGDDDEEEGGSGNSVQGMAEGEEELNFQLAFLLQGGSLTLLTGGLREAELLQSRPLTTIRYQRFKLDMTSRGGSLLVQAELGSCTVLDRWTHNIGYGFETIMTRCAPASRRTDVITPPHSPHRVRLAGTDAGSSHRPSTHLMTLATVSSALPSLLGGTRAEPLGEGRAEEAREEEGPLLCFKYVTNPPERQGIKADSRLELLLDRLTFVYNPAWLGVLLDFTNVGESEGTSPRLMCHLCSHDHASCMSVLVMFEDGR